MKRGAPVTERTALVLLVGVLWLIVLLGWAVGGLLDMASRGCL